MDSYFSWKRWSEVKNISMELFLTNSLLFTFQYIKWWTGVVWIIVMLLSAVWTLILTAPIHCRWFIGEQVMEYNRNAFLQICFHEGTNSSTSWSTFSGNVPFCLNYPFKWTQSPYTHTALWCSCVASQSWTGWSVIQCSGPCRSCWAGLLWGSSRWWNNEIRLLTGVH